MTGHVRFHVGPALVARVAARSALGVPGVVALRPDLGQALLGLAGAVLGPGGPRAHGVIPADGVHAVVSTEDGTTGATVAVTLVTRLGVNCRDLAQEVQRTVAADVLGRTGLTAQVSVTIADVLLD